MRNFKFGFIIISIAAMLLAYGCSKDEEKLISIGGDTDLVENQPGASKKVNSYIDNELSGEQTSTKVIETKLGITTVEVTSTIPTKYITHLIKAGNKYSKEFIDKPITELITDNKIKVNVKVKNSTEGFAIIHPSGNQVVVMNYNAKVGDRWSFKLNNGEKLTFNTTYRSKTDDYQYAFFNIKVVKIEQISDSDDSDVQKIVYIGNHKFGLVGLEMYLKDGSVIKGTVI